LGRGLGMSGWVKFHRKIIDNPIFRHDKNAYIVFTYLLLLVNRKNGTYDCGRFQLAEIIGGIKPTTLYKTLSRLQTAKMITQVSNNRYTTICICNWKEYQGDGNTSEEHLGNNQVTLNKKLRREEEHTTAKAVIDYYNLVFNKNVHTTPGRYQKIERRMESLHITTEDVKLAIDNARSHDFFNGSKGWQGDLDWLILNDEHLDKYINLAPAKRQKSGLMT
jgi:hypothetical protein